MSDIRHQVGARGQLYLIGTADVDAGTLAAALSAGSAAAFRLTAPAPALATAQALRHVCAGRVAFLVQDDLDLALTLGADGVHLGDPKRVREARLRLGPDRIVGASCGRSRHAAMLAGEDGADYIAFGEVGQPPQAFLLELIAWWNELFVLPCLAQGAFDGAGAIVMARAGADFIGVSDELWRCPDGAVVGMRRLLEAIAEA